MGDEPSLPRLPAISWDEHSQSFSNNPRKRVRTRRSSAASGGLFNSSDPAIFSSDDDPALDNYVEGRRKRRYVGSWFNQQPASSDSAFEEPQRGSQQLPKPKRKRSFKRQLDSGVWMGSDATDDSFDDLPLPLPPGESKLLQLDRVTVPLKKQAISPAEDFARRKIQTCLEEGKENIDLSGIGLTSLANTTIQPLEELSCIPMVTKDVPFEHKPPSLKLFLSGNPLASVPGAVFDLQHLTNLSLRGCGLRDLPPGIGRLTQLETLNLAQNALRYLPADLLDLLASPGNLRDLLLQGNDFHRADRLPEQVSPENNLVSQSPVEEELSSAYLDDRKVLSLSGCRGYTKHETPLVSQLPALYEGMAARYFARSSIEYSDSSAVIHSNFRLDQYPPTDVSVPTEDDRQEDASATEKPGLPSPPTPYQSAGRSQSDPRAHRSHVPSLLELAARSCYWSADLEDLPAYVPDSLHNIRDVLQRAAEQREIGGYQCWRCKKVMVTPVVKWLEWWQVAVIKPGRVAEARAGNDDARRASLAAPTPAFLPWSKNDEEQAVPFLRMGCSWGCVPGKMQVGAWALRDDTQIEK